MNQLDAYYRAWLNYRAITSKNRECTSFRRSLTHADQGSERLSIIRNVCRVDEDWICEIEKGLIYIEKAIKEERQFIYSNGEVVPIEKVKHISKDSVQHLAKHSSLITRVEEGEDIIPDKLYSVERLNDYAVYENRFLYMLLCYLRDFVTLRYDRILELSNKYDGALSLDKTLETPSQRISYKIELHEERRNDKYLREHNSARDTIDRIDLILKSILALLATPLMECASKVAMLKPPITKTNVLKMDNNFKAAVALYEYVIAYDKDGYTVEPRNTELSPFGEDIGDEISDVCSIISFLTYEHGLDVGAMLKNEYEREEEKRRELELQQKAEQLRLLKRRLESSEISAEEYILSLEKQMKLLENRASGMELLGRELEEMKRIEEQLTFSLKESEEHIKALDEQLEKIDEVHAQQMDALCADHRSQIEAAVARHEEELHEMERISNERISQINEQMSAERQRCREEVSLVRAQLKDNEDEYAALQEKHGRLSDEMTLCEAKLKALRIAQGLVSDGESYTDRESFGELEKEFEAFSRFYQGQWNETKKGIRKKHLKYENLKGREKQ